MSALKKRGSPQRPQQEQRMQRLCEVSPGFLCALNVPSGEGVLFSDKA